MTDSSTGKPLRVTQYSRGGPYLIIPVAQIPEVKAVLDRANLRYWVENLHISIDGQPAKTWVHFGKTTSAEEIQRALDSAGGSEGER
jgi:hypothetical protein